jgi:acyl-coenzyme A thioesterase PaaI-like protein
MTTPQPPPGYRPLPAFPWRARVRSFVSDDPDPGRIDLRLHHHPDRTDLWGAVRFGPLAEGPPRHVHGGALAAVLDEAMGYAAWNAGRSVLAGTLNLRYRAPAPLNQDLVVLASLEESRARVVLVRGALYWGERLLTEAQGQFVDVGQERFLRLLSGEEG